MAQYEVVLVKYPDLEPPDNLWWTAVCLAMPGCVSDGQTREEALAMIADAMAGHLEDEPARGVVVYDDERTEYEKRVAVAEYQERRGRAELHWVEPRFMTEEEMRNNPRFEGIIFPVA